MFATCETDGVLVTEKSPCNELLVGSEIPERQFQKVRTLLLARRGFDLGNYKAACIRRRIAARIRALGFNDAEPYIAVLRQGGEEIDALLEALTIHVSQFFRNPSVFAFLRQTVLPELLRRARAAGRKEVRLWSVGCAGGEEAFSLALLLEELPTEDMHIDILGTDVSQGALEAARKGLFPPQKLEEVPPGLLERHFSAEGKFFRLNRSVRERVRFENHDILSAPEYPAADLILCRNVLIYFSGREQEKIQRRFAAALEPRGFLVLGRAETLLGSSRQLFSVECSTERVYRRREP